jgi:hypothetical protein
LKANDFHRRTDIRAHKSCPAGGAACTIARIGKWNESAIDWIQVSRNAGAKELILASGVDVDRGDK